MYEFAFCVGEINDGFSIETVVPRRRIPCSSVETLVQCGIDCSCLLTVSYTSDVDILQSLSEVLRKHFFPTYVLIFKIALCFVKGKQQECSSKEESFTSVLEKGVFHISWSANF